MRQRTKTDILVGIKQTAIATSFGSCDLPILYRDGSLLAVGYRIDPARVRSILGDLPLEPLVLFGRALILLLVFEHRDTTIGSYNEIGIGIYVRRAKSSPSLWRILRDMRKVEEVGLYIAALPVTTKTAFTVGVELWGYPKYVTDIKTSFVPDSVQTTLENELVLTHSCGFGLEMDGIPFITYTFLKNRLIRTIVDVGHRVRFGGASTVQLTILGDGATAATVRTLGLDAVRPAFAFRTDSFKAILPLGKDLGAIGA